MKQIVLNVIGDTQVRLSPKAQKAAKAADAVPEHFSFDHLNAKARARRMCAVTDVARDKQFNNALGMPPRVSVFVKKNPRFANLPKKELYEKAAAGQERTKRKAQRKLTVLQETDGESK